jgi:hypothetical protein
MPILTAPVLANDNGARSSHGRYYEQPCSSSRLQESIPVLEIFCEAQEFSRHILRIRSRTSREMADRPGLPRRTF